MPILVLSVSCTMKFLLLFAYWHSRHSRIHAAQSSFMHAGVRVNTASRFRFIVKQIEQNNARWFGCRSYVDFGYDISKIEHKTSILLERTHACDKRFSQFCAVSKFEFRLISVNFHNLCFVSSARLPLPYALSHFLSSERHRPLSLCRQVFALLHMVVISILAMTLIII